MVYKALCEKGTEIIKLKNVSYPVFSKAYANTVTSSHRSLNAQRGKSTTVNIPIFCKQIFHHSESMTGIKHLLKQCAYLFLYYKPNA